MFYAVRGMRGNSRNAVRINFYVSVYISKTTYYNFTNTAVLRLENFCDFFSAKMNKFSVMGVKVVIL
jgi:hypothetical protein